MTQEERYQQAWRTFEEQHGYMPASGRQAAEWAYEQGLLIMPNIDPMSVMARIMSRAMRAEYDTAPDGRRYRVNHPVHVTEDGVQLTIWSIIDHIPHENMEMSLQQRREQTLADVYQMKTDRDIYRCKFPDRPSINLVFDYTEDVAERDAAFGIFAGSEHWGESEWEDGEGDQ